MVKNIQIAFDLTNSKEYVLEYFAKELPKDKIPENLREKDFYILDKKIVEKPLGTTMLDLLNLNLAYNVHDISYFIIHYAMVPFLTFTYPLVYKNLEYYKNSTINFNEKETYDLIMTEEELNIYAEIVRIKSAFLFDDTQFVFRMLVDGDYFKRQFETALKADSDYFKLKKLKDCSDYLTALNDMSPHFKDIKINYDIENFFLNNVPENCDVSHYYISDDLICIFYVTLREMLKIRKNFKIIRCNLCNNYFIPESGHKTKYCDNIYLDDKTCKQYASNNITDKKYKDDPYLDKYRKRYQNLYKTACDNPTSKSAILYEKYKKEGAIKTDLYKKGLITGDELIKWVESMRVNK